MIPHRSTVGPDVTFSDLYVNANYQVQEQTQDRAPPVAGVHSGAAPWPASSQPTLPLNELGTFSLIQQETSNLYYFNESPSPLTLQGSSIMSV